jgi:hypothetical protein
MSVAPPRGRRQLSHVVSALVALFSQGSLAPTGADTTHDIFIPPKTSIYLLVHVNLL